MKIKAVKFEILFHEGTNTHTGAFDSWFEFGQCVSRIAQSAPTGGAYDKTDFKVTFEDDTTYEGRLDVQHFTMPMESNDNDPAAHILQHVRFYAGEWKPDHMSQDDYDIFIQNTGPEAAQENKDFLANYDIPESDGYIDEKSLTYCQKCGKLFQFWAWGVSFDGDKDKFCGRCQHEKNEQERKTSKRKAEQEVKDADPLSKIRDRSEVTKAMRKMLRQRSGKTWSVKGGRGTGWGWLEITSPPSRDGGGLGITPEDGRELADLLGLDQPVHQYESVPSGQWYHYLKACRGDFSDGKNWRDNYYIKSGIYCHVLNSCREGAKTAADLLETFDPNESGYWEPVGEDRLDHILHVLIYRGEMVRKQGRYKLAEETPAVETGPDDEPAEVQPEPAIEPVAVAPAVSNSAFCWTG